MEETNDLNGRTVLDFLAEKWGKTEEETKEHIKEYLENHPNRRAEKKSQSYPKVRYALLGYWDNDENRGNIEVIKFYDCPFKAYEDYENEVSIQQKDYDSREFDEYEGRNARLIPTRIVKIETIKEL